MTLEKYRKAPDARYVNGSIDKPLREVIEQLRGEWSCEPSVAARVDRTLRRVEVESDQASPVDP